MHTVVTSISGTDALEGIVVVRLDALLDRDALADEQTIQDIMTFMLDVALKEDVEAIIVDMGCMDTMSSVLLQVFLRTYKRLRVRGAQFAICGLAAPVLGLFEVTRLDRIFLLCETRQEALDALAG